MVDNYTMLMLVSALLYLESLLFEKVTIITLLYLTTLGDIQMQSFEVVSGDSCESWYHHNVKVGEKKNVKYSAIIITTSIKAKTSLVIYVVMNRHNKPIPLRGNNERG